MKNDDGGADDTARAQDGARSPKPQKDTATGRFLAGNSGNGGRPRGARSRLGEEFLASMLDDFEAHGADAISKVREEDPSTYLRVIASLLPKEVKVDANPLTDVSDEELDRMIGVLRDQINAEKSGGQDSDDGASGPH